MKPQAKLVPCRACRGTGYIDICEFHHKKATRECRALHSWAIVPFACTSTNFGAGHGCGMTGWAPSHFGSVDNSYGEGT